MGASENLAVHTALTEAENRHDFSYHGDYLHDDIEFHLLGGEVLVGLDTYVTDLQAGYEALEGFSVVLDDQFATGDRVVCRWRARAAHTGDHFGFPATGEEIEVPWHEPVGVRSRQGAAWVEFFRPGLADGSVAGLMKQ
jgi:predicted ester cyclase